MVYVQFKDATEAKVVAVFSCAQDSKNFPHQAEVEETDARYVAFVEKFSGQAVEARRLRDALIASCDWTVGNDSPLSATTQDLWKKYRQALRDVPEQSGFPASIVWPTKPV